ncbi:MAG: TraR/DksA family transcriptional regulator [Phycisphaerales bacterium]|nr:TraR/DksA family transcriptional regulator [Phycisphaerales bacterium]
MASTTTKKTTTKKTSKKAAAPKPTKKKTSTTKDTTKKAPTKKAPAKSSKSAPKSSKSTSAKTSTKSAKEPKAKPEPKKPAAPRFRTFFSSADDGAAAAKKLAAAAGLTKLKDEGKRIAAAPAEKRLTKSPLSKKERDHYKEILLLKRAQLVGDVTNMETEALTGGGSGSLSSLPQHMADAGSDTYDQSLNLDLAAGQRKLLREIDDALGRIADNTFGICEYLGVQINAERLENTPWARYSIEGAREMEHLGLL